MNERIITCVASRSEVIQNRRGMGGPPMSSVEKHGRAARATGAEIASYLSREFENRERHDYPK